MIIRYNIHIILFIAGGRPGGIGQMFWLCESDFHGTKAQVTRPRCSERAEMVSLPPVFNCEGDRRQRLCEALVREIDKS